MPNLSIVETTTIYHTPKLGSPSDHEPNPFVENRADRNRPSLPGLFDISRNKPSATIVEELNLEEELLEEASILSPKIIQKAVDLVSSKTIARALQHSAMPGVSAGKVDPNLRAPVLFTKQEATRKVELSPDLESL